MHALPVMTIYLSASVRNKHGPPMVLLKGPSVALPVVSSDGGGAELHRIQHNSTSSPCNS